MLVSGATTVNVNLSEILKNIEWQTTSGFILEDGKVYHYEYDSRFDIEDKNLADQESSRAIQVKKILEGLDEIRRYYKISKYSND